MPSQWISYHQLPVPQMLLCLLLFLNSGCTYLHNQQNATVSKEILSEFSKFRQLSSDPYLLMLKNLQKTELKATQLQAELARQTALAFASQVNTVTWEQIKKELEKEKTEHEERNKKLVRALEAFLKEKGEKEAEVKDAEDGLNKAKALLKKAVKEQQKWEARQVLFRSTIKFLAEAAAKDKELEPQTLKEAKEKILDQKIPIEILKDDNLTTEDSTVGKVLSEDVKALEELEFGELLRKYTIGNFDPQSAPGLTVTILSLGVDLARAQLDRAELEIKYLQAYIGALTAQKENSEYIAKALKIIENRTKENSFVLADTVLRTINELQKQQNKEGAIQDAFEALAWYSVAKTLDESARLELETRPTILEHEYSIRLSAINAREHEALIGRGLQGLVIYHENGVTPAMIANFLRAAQAAALAVIGAGVL